MGLFELVVFLPTVLITSRGVAAVENEVDVSWSSEQGPRWGAASEGGDAGPGPGPGAVAEEVLQATDRILQEEAARRELFRKAMRALLRAGLPPSGPPAQPQGQQALAALLRAVRATPLLLGAQSQANAPPTPTRLKRQAEAPPSPSPASTPTSTPSPSPSASPPPSKAAVGGGRRSLLPLDASTLHFHPHLTAPRFLPRHGLFSPLQRPRPAPCALHAAAGHQGLLAAGNLHTAQVASHAAVAQAAEAGAAAAEAVEEPLMLAAIPRFCVPSCALRRLLAVRMRGRRSVHPGTSHPTSQSIASTLSPRNTQAVALEAGAGAGRHGHRHHHGRVAQQTQQTQHQQPQSRPQPQQKPPSGGIPLPFLDPSMTTDPHAGHFHRRELANDFGIVRRR